jgi:hypothetical protein
VKGGAKPTRRNVQTNRKSQGLTDEVNPTARQAISRRKSGFGDLEPVNSYLKTLVTPSQIEGVTPVTLREQFPELLGRLRMSMGGEEVNRRLAALITTHSVRIEFKEEK